MASTFPVVGRGKEDKQKASEAMRVYLVALVERNQRKQKDQINQMKQISATRREICGVPRILSLRTLICHCHMTIGGAMGGGLAVIASANLEMSFVSPGGDLHPFPLPIRAIPSLPRFSVHSPL